MSLQLSHDDIELLIKSLTRHIRLVCDSDDFTISVRQLESIARKLTDYKYTLQKESNEKD